MANTDTPMGFKPVAMLSGAPWNGKVTMYNVVAADATLIGIGDLVVLDGSADADGVRGVTRAAANGVCVGPVVGKVYDTPDGLGTQHRAASTQEFLLVADDPDIIMMAQEDADGGALAVASLGLNVNFIVADANSTTGTSQMEVDTSTVATTNTLPLRLVGFVRSPDNTPASAQAKVLVAFNTHQYRSNTGSTGV